MAFSCSTQGNLPLTTPAYMSVYSMSSYPSYPSQPVSVAPPADDNEYADYDPDADWLAQQHSAPPPHMQLPPVSHLAPSVASDDDMAAFFASQIVPSPPVECDVNVGDNDCMVLYYEDDDGFSTVLFVEPPVYGAAPPVCDDDDAMYDL